MVTGQAPVTLELRNTPAREKHKQTISGISLQFDASQRGKKMLNSCRDKKSGRHLSGEGEGSPLDDLRSEIYYWEDESNASITINGMGKRIEVKCISAACWNNTIPKQVAPIDSIWTDCCCIMQLVHVQLVYSHAQRT